MTLKDAILKSLQEINKAATYVEVCNNILSKGYYDFGEAKTPNDTVSSILGNFIRDGDSRVKRVKQNGRTFVYYLTKNEPDFGSQLEIGTDEPGKGKKPTAKPTYHERDLHILLTSYLNSLDIYAKTVFHEQSTFSKDSNQVWTHPDVVGIRFLNLSSKAGQTFLKSIDRNATFKLSSYEIKKEINSDTELKKAFFQAVSNSSWANYGYLVAFEFGDSLLDEMERLNQAFGIGLLKLSANPYESKVLFQPKQKPLDFKTIDKLCNINGDFNRFIEQTEKLMNADDKYTKAMEKELEAFCDGYFRDEAEMEAYLKAKNIPLEQGGIEETARESLFKRATDAWYPSGILDLLLRVSEVSLHLYSEGVVKLCRIKAKLKVI
jgi:hypothetical protein